MNQKRLYAADFSANYLKLKEICPTQHACRPSCVEKLFKLTPLALACALAFSSASFADEMPINATQVTTSADYSKYDYITDEMMTAMGLAQTMQEKGSGQVPLDIYTGTISLDEISDDDGDFKLTEVSAPNDLISFMRTEKPNLTGKVNPGRVQLEASADNSDVSYDNGIYLLKTKSGDPWTLKYDFSKDGTGAGGQPHTDNTTALSFFDYADFNYNGDGPHLNDLKYYIFASKVNVITQNHLVKINNGGQGTSDFGLSLSNKRKNITFTQEAFLASDFSFYEGSNSNSDGTQHLSVAAGVYNAFGTNVITNEAYGETLFDNREKTDLAQALGKITFKDFATISVTQKGRQDLNLTNLNAGDGAVFGLYHNEGGTTEFENGADIVVKAFDNNKTISAVSSSASLGIFDFLKQGTITINASQDDRVSRIWGLSVDNDKDDENILFVKEDETVTKNSEEASTPNYVGDDDWQARWDTYIDQLNNSNNINLENAILSLHGSAISVTDEGKSGYFDIRGDIVASSLNSSDAGSNTVKKFDIDENNTWLKIGGTVNQSTVEITLTNEKSVLYGNIYERHRIGKEETIEFQSPVNGNYNKFTDWNNYQKELEQNSLGGNVQLSLSNGATWYMQKNWKGWNNDLIYDKFNNTVEALLKEGIPDTITYNKDNVVIEYDATKTDNIYEKIDFSDQYNLNVFDKEKNVYVTVNNGYYDDSGHERKYNEDKVNDLDLASLATNSEDEGIHYAYQKAGEYTTVDNGIYHLTLKQGGVVDTRYMRMDFAFDSVDAINSGIGEFDDGIKKLRVQELDGTGGTFSIYAKDYNNHDLIIIDGIKEGATKAENSVSVSINFDIWNQDAGDLGIVANNALTFVQIGRIAQDISFNEQIVVGPAIGNILQYTYDVKADADTDTDKDEYLDWTYAQELEYHDQMHNVFIVNSRSEVDPGIVEGVRLSSSMAYNYAVMDIDRLQKRRGEARYIDQQKDGLWARYRHLNSGLSGYDNQADVVQIGYDHKVRNDESYNVYSIAFDYLHGESDFSNGDGELDRYSLGLYDTWLLDNGSYLDLSAKVGWFDADTDLGFNTAKGQYYDLSGDYDFWGASIGAEIGRKFANEDQWFFEPQSQLTYTYIGDFDYDTPNQVKVESDNVDSLIMRLGFRVGKDFGKSVEDGLYSIYLMGDALHEFLGDQELTVTGGDASEKLKFDGDRTWYDVGVGVSCTLGESSYMFINYERALGSDMDNTWEVSAGLSYVF